MGSFSPEPPALGANSDLIYPCFANEETEPQKGGVTSSQKLVSGTEFHLRAHPGLSRTAPPHLPSPFFAGLACEAARSTRPGGHTTSAVLRKVKSQELLSGSGKSVQPCLWALGLRLEHRIPLYQKTRNATRERPQHSNQKAFGDQSEGYS